jgi:glutathione peroxidase
MKLLKYFLVLMTTQFICLAQAKTFYDLEAETFLDGKVKFNKYKNKVVLVVNTASGCGYTPQLTDLQKVYSKYKDQGFEVLAFPSDDFDQEKLDGKHVADYCKREHGAKYTVFDKIHVNGSSRHPVFKYLVKNSDSPKKDIRWNFEKFLVGKDGKVVGRYYSNNNPNSEAFKKIIEAELKK